MRYATEPPFTHGQPARTAVLLVNLGTPAAPTAAALRQYLAEFLWDPRVVEIPRPVWWLILHGVILRTRPARSAAKYASIWTDQGSPLMHWSQRQAEGLAQAMAARGHAVAVRLAMRYGQPSVASALDALAAEGATRILVLPLYPQYAAATTASVVDAVSAWTLRHRHLPSLRFVNRYHDDLGYIAALAASVRTHWAAHGQGERLLMSFHGVPARSLTLGDPYHCECHKTARLLREALGLAPEQVVVSFQSRLGRAQWLQPYTEPTVKALAAQGVRHIDAICPGFAADNLETLEEVGMEVRDAFLQAGGQRFGLVPCLNDQPAWLDALAALAEQHLLGWPTHSPTATELAAGAAQRERALSMGAST
jgi:protoporphyrin/coproporphyrin ferrochelatase